jgi:cell division septation protein DedD
MMKKLWIQWSVLLLCFSVSVAGQEVNIFMDHPDKVKAGEEFEVKVTIEKGSLTDYSRFSQDLPNGLTASNVSSPNADFSFDNQRIRIIWLKMPDLDQVEVTYKISVDERLKGTFVLGGVFAYVVEDERKFLNFEQSGQITIVPDPSVDPALVVDILDFDGSLDEAPAAVPGGDPYAMVIRQEPELLASGGYMVRLLVSNPEGSRYAKIEEIIPQGYIFEKVDSHGGIESFSSGTVKFIWMRLPEEPVFEVSYRLVPKRDEPQGDMKLTGQFTYTIGDDSKVKDIKQLNVSLEKLNQPEKRNLLLTGKIPEGSAGSAGVTATQQSSTPTGQGTLSRAGSGTGETNRQGGQQSTQGSAPGGTVKTPEQPAASREPVSGTKILPAGTGDYFRVQLIATSNAFDANRFFRGTGLDREIFVEQQGRLYKYTVGSFRTYSEAKQYKDRLDRIPQVDGPFVVAYRDGRRIPLDPSQR